MGTIMIMLAANRTGFKKQHFPLLCWAQNWGHGSCCLAGARVCFSPCPPLTAGSTRKVCLSRSKYFRVMYLSAVCNQHAARISDIFLDVADDQTYKQATVSHGFFNQPFCLCEFNIKILFLLLKLF